MSLVVVGSFGIDTVETPYGKVEGVVGGSALYFSLAASLFTEVRLAGNIGADFPSEPLQTLRSRGADLNGVQTFENQPTFRWSGRYCGDMSEAETLLTELNVLLEPPRIPSAYKDSPFAFLANMGPDTQLATLKELQADMVFADTMNLWIETALPDLLKVLQQVDGLILNETEARALTGEDLLLKAGSALLQMGPKIIVIKKGEHGAILFADGMEFHVPAYPTRLVVDPTGAGDSFAGGFLGSLAKAGKVSPPSLRLAMAMGTVAASCTVEHFSTAGLEAATIEELDGRFLGLREFVDFGTPE